MVLINRPDEPHAYYSRAWRTTSSPDIATARDDVAKITKRHVEQQLGECDHKPVLLVIRQDLRQAGRKLCPSWNYTWTNRPEFRNKKLMITAENWRWCNITRIRKWIYSQEPSSELPKKQFPEDEEKTTSQAGMHSFKKSAVLWADSEKMQPCLTNDNTAAYSKAKADFTRQKLQQTLAAWYDKNNSLNMDKNSDKLEAYKAVKWGPSGKKKHRRSCSQRESLLLKRSSQLLAKLYQKDSKVKPTKGKNQSSQRAANSAAEAAHIRQMPEQPITTK